MFKYRSNAKKYSSAVVVALVRLHCILARLVTGV